MTTATLTETGAAAASRRARVRAVRRVLTRKPGRIAGLSILVFFVLLGTFGPMCYPDQLTIDPDAVYQAPSSAHWLGTDFAGADVLQATVVGSRYVLLTCALAGLFAVGLGTAVGLLAGFHRGLPDSLLMRATDFVLTIPGLPVLVVLSTIWAFSSPLEMGLVLGIVGWGGIARAVRSQVLSLRERGFLEAARGLGLPSRHILLRELLPNIAPYVAMHLLLAVIGFVEAQVGLFFLGIVPFSTTNWGVMINQAVFSGGALQSPEALFYLLAPLTCILLLIMGVVLFLDAIDELFNPRLRER
ncbi:ABC transporter permease [Streptomyces sp. NPDC051940]|uniref:ABC transporter permease n=1 Tax=Streptomyces sp. NPDC051940 TaxID=3155675 RepID=UPI0034304BCF